MRHHLKLLALPALAAATLAASLSVASALPNVLTVTTLDDSGVGSLRQAIADAEGSPGADSIDFAEGLTGTITLASSLPQITETLIITGPGRDVLAVSGDDAYQPFHVTGAGVVLTMSDLTVAHGLAESGGGAYVADDASIVLDSMLIESNTALNVNGGGSGGGLYISTDGTASISNTIIRNNLAADPNAPTGMGGGAYIYANELSITDTQFTDNTADVAGGIIGGSATTMIANGVVISRNVATNFVGGANINSNEVLISNSIIADNTATIDVGGAGIYAETVTASNVRVSGNSSAESGGLTIAAPNSTLDRLTITGNSGAAVGGLHDSGVSTITSSTIADNDGIGILLNEAITTSIDGLSPSARYLVSDLTIAHSTIVGNSGPGITTRSASGCLTSLATPNADISICSLSGQSLPVQSLSAPSSRVQPSVPGPAQDASVVLDHTLVSGNSTDIEFDVEASWSLVSDPGSSTASGSTNIIGVPAEVEPLLLIDEYTSVIPIPMGSAAWNVGDPAFVAPPATDQAGQSRVIDIIDIGAYEQQTPLPVIVVPAFTG